MKINPYYDPKSLGLDMCSFEEPISYEFNILAFWKTPDGQIYTASDVGCSDPTPFEGFDSANLSELLPQLERVPDFDKAQQIFDQWNQACDCKPVTSSTFQTLKGWFL